MWTAALALACGSDDRVDLVVELRTDFLPAVDFVGTEVRLDGLAEPESLLAYDKDVREPFRIARFAGLERGARTVDVRLISAEGQVVFRRPVRVELRANTGVTITAHRRCLNIECDDGQACLGGACVDATCVEERPEACDALECVDCGEACETSDDCSNVGSCRGECLSGRCGVDVVSECGASALCHPDDGCLELATPATGSIVVAVVGDGVVSNDELGDCGPDERCEYSLPLGSRHVFVGRANPGSRSWGWIRGCTDGETCEVEADGSAGVTADLHAIFAPPTGELVTLELQSVASEPWVDSIDDLWANPDDSILLASAVSNRIYRVTLSGDTANYEIVAGTGSAGFVNGPARGGGELAQFAQPMGVASDDAGNIYVADNGNARIRRIDASGMVTTFAGSGSGVASDGPLATAGVPRPREVVWRSSDRTVWVLENETGTVRIIDEAADEVRTPSIGVDARGDFAADDAGRIAFFHHQMLFEVPPDSEESSRVPTFCNELTGWGGNGWRVATAAGQIALRKSHLCVANSDTSRFVLRAGSMMVDGPDYEARLGTTQQLVLMPDGQRIVFADLESGEPPVLRLYRPL